MRVAYVRVSTAEQNEDRQITALEKYDIEKWYSEKVSGKNIKRPKLQEMLDFVRDGDIVYVHDFSRLARSTKDLLNITETLKNKNVTLVSNKENIDTSTPQGKLMLTMLGAIAEFERENILERQREGIAEAKKRGAYKGRKPIVFTDEEFNIAYKKYKNREITKTKFAEILDISRPTLDKILKEYLNK